MITDEELRRILAEGVRLFDAGRFFECHDKLEEGWKAVKQEKKAEKAADPRRDFLHGLILLAVAFHHWRNANAIGSLRKWSEADRLLQAYPASFLGVEVGRVRAEAASLFREVARDPDAPFPAGRVPLLGPH